jgi:hypothetical protein
MNKKNIDEQSLEYYGYIQEGNKKNKLKINK